MDSDHRTGDNPACKGPNSSARAMHWCLTVHVQWEMNGHPFPFSILDINWLRVLAKTPVMQVSTHAFYNGRCMLSTGCVHPIKLLTSYCSFYLQSDLTLVCADVDY